MTKILEKIAEIICWLQIAFMPFFIGFAIGALVYFSNPNSVSLIVGTGLSFLGLIIGVIFANKVWKTKGTLWFVSRVSATPELDNLESNNINSEKGSR